jgi:hypothetical protein
VPTLRVSGDIPEEWYIETVFRTDWSTVPVVFYTQAGIVITTGAKNYFQVLITRDAFGQTSTVYGSTNSEQDDNFAWGERVTNTWTPDDQWMGVRIERVFGEDPHIVVKFRHSGTNGWIEYDGFNGGRYYPDSPFYQHIMSMLSQGARIGVYTDNACGCGLRNRSSSTTSRRTCLCCLWAMWTPTASWTTRTCWRCCSTSARRATAWTRM